jgi:steroid delta-isomerase-like uncharacterized protein
MRSRHIVLGAALSATVALAAGLAVSGAAASAQTAGTRPAAAAEHSEWSVTAGANKRLVLQFVQDVLNGHNGSHAASYLTEDMQWHGGTVGTIAGRDNVAGLLTTVVTSIPDLHAAVQDIFGQGDKVVVRLIVSGTQEGPLLNIPATGRHVQWDAVDVYQLEGGKISQEWAAEDFTAFLNDTGTYKAPWIS